MSKEIYINNVLSSIIWTAAKLQEQHTYENPLSDLILEKLKKASLHLDDVLDYVEAERAGEGERGQF